MSSFGDGAPANGLSQLEIGCERPATLEQALAAADLGKSMANLISWLTSPSGRNLI